MSIWPDIIAAFGAVITSILALYLLHRRIVADKETIHWRNGQQENAKLLVMELRAEIASLKAALLAQAEKTKSTTDCP